MHANRFIYGKTFARRVRKKILQRRKNFLEREREFGSAETFSGATQLRRDCRPIRAKNKLVNIRNSFYFLLGAVARVSAAPRENKKK